MTQNRLTTRRHARDNLYRVWLLSQNSRFALRIHPARKSEQSLGQVDKTPGILRLAPQLARGEYPPDWSIQAVSSATILGRPIEA